MWHGWLQTRLGPECTNGSLHIGPLPGRKQVALYIEGEGVINVLAYFKSEASAEWALRAIDTLTHVKA